MAEFGISILFQYCMSILAKFNTFKPRGNPGFISKWFKCSHWPPPPICTQTNYGKIPNANDHIIKTHPATSLRCTRYIILCSAWWGHKGLTVPTLWWNTSNSFSFSTTVRWRMEFRAGTGPAGFWTISHSEGSCPPIFSISSRFEKQRSNKNTVARLKSNILTLLKIFGLATTLFRATLDNETGDSGYLHSCWRHRLMTRGLGVCVKVTPDPCPEHHLWPECDIWPLGWTSALLHDNQQPLKRDRQITWRAKWSTWLAKPILLLSYFWRKAVFSVLDSGS